MRALHNPLNGIHRPLIPSFPTKNQGVKASREHALLWRNHQGHRSVFGEDNLSWVKGLGFRV